MEKYGGIILNSFLVAAILAAAMMFSWSALSFTDFFYSGLSGPMGVKEYISANAKDNKNAGRKLFEHVDAETRNEIFSDIIKGINDGGSGFHTLFFNTKGKKVLFLNEEEKLNLWKFSEFVFRMKMAAYALMLLGLFSIIFIVRLGIKLMSPVSSYLGMFAILVLVVAGWLFFGVGNLFPAGTAWLYDPSSSLIALMIKSGSVLWAMNLILVILSVLFYIVIYNVIRTLFKNTRGVNY